MLIQLVNNFYGLSIQLFFTFISALLLSFCWNWFLKFKFLSSYSKSHAIHENEICRLGGLLFFLGISTYSFLNYSDSLINHICISLIPIILIGVKEDLFHDVDPNKRLFAMTISILIFFYFNNFTFPVIDTPVIDFLNDNLVLASIFFSFSILVLINGMNMIDGMNGLLLLVSFCQLFSLYEISNYYNDQDIVKLIVVFSLFLLTIFLFNFPFGKIFMGDTGAYMLGFVIGSIVIVLYARHDDLSPYSAILILIYPCFEVLFSVIRKLLKSESPFLPDANHLHTLVFKMINKNLKQKNLIFKNSFTTVILFPLWLIPSVLTIKFYNDLKIVLLCIFIYLIFYLILYLFFQNINSKE